MYSLGKWTDLGAGCCSKRKEFVLINESLKNDDTNDLDACKKKCLGKEKCKFVVYGWKDGNKWCTAYSSDKTCKPLKYGPKDCGSRGDNGVHSYEYDEGMITLS